PGVTTATSYTHAVSLLSFLAPCGVAAAALQVFRQRMAGARVTLAILFLAEIAAALPSGLKQNFVTAALAVAIPYAAGRNKVPKKLLAIIVIVLLTVVIPFTAAYRAAARQPGVTGTAG